MSAAIVLLLSLIPLLPSGPANGQVPPEGYQTFDDLSRSHPEIVSVSGGVCTVSDSLEVPASRPLYVGPGETVLVAAGASLTLRGSTIIAGTSEGPITFGPSEDGVWGGIEAVGSGSDLLTARNLTLSGASVGIRLKGVGMAASDLLVSECASTGIEARQSPLSPGMTIDGASVTDCRFYGISLWESPNVRLSRISIVNSSSGIRAYRSHLSIMDLDVMNSTGNGVQLVDSELSGEGIRLTTDRAATFTTSAQVSATNSTVLLEACRIGHANRGLMALRGSSLMLSDLDLGPVNLQGIIVEDGALSISSGALHDCAEGAVYASGSSFQVQGTELTRNGAGHGTASSTMVVVNSTGSVEGTAFLDRQKADMECYGSTVTVSNTTYAPGPTPFILGDSSTMTFGNAPPPAQVKYLDPFSRTRYLSFISVSVVDHPDMEGRPDALVDLRDRTGSTVSSARTGTDGTTPLLGYIVYTNNSLETRSRMPLTIFASAKGKMVSSIVLEYPAAAAQMVLYPPNSPPELWIDAPKEGSTAGPSLTVSGRVEDDIGVTSISVRIDTAGSFFVTIAPDGQGLFSATVSLLDIGSGTHLMEFRAFDGAQSSPPSFRNVTVVNPINTDSDHDGLTDRMEDRNSNGSVDPGETDPRDDDTDDDGLIDGIEDQDGNGRVDANETDPLDPDSDSDFLLDGVEDSNGNGRVDANETDPLDPDTDRDGINDRDDADPLLPGETPVDEESEDEMTVLVLATVVFLLAMVLAYLLFVRIGTGSRGARTASRHGPMKRGDDGPRES